MSIRAIGAVLEPLIQQRQINHNKWVHSILQEGENPAKFFPFEPSNGTGILGNRMITIQQDDLSTLSQNSQKPLYFIQMPVVLPLHKGRAHLLFRQIMEKIRDQAFRNNSAQKVPRHIVVLIGANRRRSLSPFENALFFHIVTTLPRIENISYQVIARLWQGNWCLRLPFQKISKKVYSVTKAFFLLKSLRAETAKAVFASFNWRSQIPYQSIREWLKTHTFTEAVIDTVLAIPRPLYLTTMDGDTQSLKGLFSFCTRKINEWVLQTGKYPQLFSPGYFVSQNERDVIRIGTDLCMRVRKAIAKILPMAVYYPEPCMLFRIRSKKLFGSCSFLGPGKRQDMEGYQLIKSALRSKALNPQHAFFPTKRILITKTPERMYTEKNARIVIDSVATLGKKETLQALRFLSQNHFHPIKWARIVAATCPVAIASAGVLHKHICKIYHLFDPIHLAQTIPFGGKYSYKQFLAILDTYPEIQIRLAEMFDASEERQANLFEEISRLFLHKSAEERNAIRTYFQTLFEEALQAKVDCRQLQIPDRWIAKVVQTAQASGLALHTGLDKERNGFY